MAGALRSQDGKLVGPGSVKALEMRGYNVTSGDTGDYTIDSANTEEDKNYSQEQESLDSAFIPDDESFTGSTILDTTYNEAKTVSDFALETLPAAERHTPHMTKPTCSKSPLQPPPPNRTPPQKPRRI